MNPQRVERQVQSSYSLEELQAFGQIAARKMAVERQRNRQKSIERFQTSTSFGIPTRYEHESLETYQPSNQEQRKALTVCTNYVNRFKEVRRAGKPLVLCGPRGTGKTHLACSVVRAVGESGALALYITQEQMMRNIRSSYDREGEESNTLASYTEVDLLCIDEIGVGLGDENKRKAQLSSIIDERYANNRPTIIITNLDHGPLKNYLGKSAYERLFGHDAIVVPVTGESWRMKGREI